MCLAHLLILLFLFCVCTARHDDHVRADEPGHRVQEHRDAPRGLTCVSVPLILLLSSLCCLCRFFPAAMTLVSAQSDSPFVCLRAICVLRVRFAFAQFDSLSSLVLRVLVRSRSLRPSPVTTSASTSRASASRTSSAAWYALVYFVQFHLYFCDLCWLMCG